MTRMRREDLAVQGLGLTWPAGLMVPDGRESVVWKRRADRLECDRCDPGWAPAREAALSSRAESGYLMKSTSDCCMIFAPEARAAW